MAKINVILQASAKDRGVRKFLRESTDLADKFAASMFLAKTSAAQLGKLDLSGLAAAGGRGPGPARGRGRGGSGSGGRGGVPTVDRAMRAAQKATAAAARREAKLVERGVSQRARAQQQRARADQRRVKAAARAAKNIENLSDVQLQEIEVQREINRRRRRASRRAAETKLGKDTSLKPTNQMTKGGRGVQFGANLAIAGAEFEQAGAQIERGVRSSFDSFREFEKGIVEISTLGADIPISEIERITKGAAEQFGGLPTEQTKAFYAIISAGATNAKDAQEQLNAANKLAIAGAASQESSVLAISKAVANFGSQGVTATKASDSLFAAVQKGQTTVEGMARALPIIAQAASTAGLSIDETNGVIAVLSKRFPTATEGASAFRQGLSNIAKPSKAARKEAKRLGIDFSTAGIEAAGGIEEFLLKLGKAEKFDENTLAKLFRSTEARAAIGGLIDGAEELNDTITFTEKAAGGTGKAFGEMADTTAQKAAKMEAKFELLKIQAGESLIPALTELADQLSPIIEKTTEWLRENPELASTIGKVAIGAAVLARGIGVLTSVVSMGSTVMALGKAAAAKYNAGLERLTKSAPKAGKAIKGLGKVNLAGPFLVATAAFVGFEKALEAATEAADVEQNRLDKLNEISIDFKTKGGKEKSEAELLNERRNRLIDNLEGAEGQIAASSGTQFKRQIGQGNVTSAAETFGTFGVDLLSGALGEKERQQDAAALELQSFDKQFGSQLGLTEETRFKTTAGTGLDFDAMVEELRKLNETSAATAANTSQNLAAGPSMEAGLV